MNELRVIETGADPQIVRGRVVAAEGGAKDQPHGINPQDVYAKAQPAERGLGWSHLTLGVGMAGMAVLAVAAGRVPAAEVLAFAGVGALVGGVIGGAGAIEEREPPAQAARYALALAGFLGSFGAFGWTVLSWLR